MGNSEPRLIISEAVFNMNGDIAKRNDMETLAQRHHAQSRALL